MRDTQVRNRDKRSQTKEEGQQVIVCAHAEQQGRIPGLLGDSGMVGTLGCRRQPDLNQSGVGFSPITNILLQDKVAPECTCTRTRCVQVKDQLCCRTSDLRHPGRCRGFWTMTPFVVLPVSF